MFVTFLPFRSVRDEFLWKQQLHKHIMKNDALHTRRAGSTSAVWGYVMVLAAALSFLGSMYTMFVAKLPALLLPSPGESDTSTATRGGSGVLLKAIEEDVYYCFLVPLAIPVSIVAFYANWVSLKFFRHN